MKAARPAERLALLTTRGRVAVIVCPLCGALVVAPAEERHDATHRADARRDSTQPTGLHARPGV